MMSHTSNKVRWCLKKGEEEIKENNNKHRGLIKIKSNINLARKHILKSEHNLKAITEFKRIGFSDWSASAGFYSIYHSLLAIITKKGYECRNQECTFALIYQMIENNEINLKKELVKQIHQLNPDEKHEDSTIIKLREQEQYGISLSLEEEKYKKLLFISKTILHKTKEIIET